MKRRSSEAKTAEVVAQATLRLRSKLECERVIRLAHSRGVASATAYRGPEDSPIFVMFLDVADELDRFLPELRELTPEAPISLIREAVEHVSPADFLRGGVLEPKPFRAGAWHLGWVFAGGTLGCRGSPAGRVGGLLRQPLTCGIPGERCW